jgi:hypothetical protein
MSIRFWQWLLRRVEWLRFHPFSPLVRFANYTRWKAVGSPPAGSYKKARGVLAGLRDEPAEVTIRRIRDMD